MIPGNQTTSQTGRCTESLSETMSGRQVWRQSTIMGQSSNRSRSTPTSQWTSVRPCVSCIRLQIWTPLVTSIWMKITTVTWATLFTPMSTHCQPLPLIWCTKWTKVRTYRCAKGCKQSVGQLLAFGFSQGRLLSRLDRKAPKGIPLVGITTV